MSKRSTSGLDLNEETAAIVEESRQLREVLKFKTEELRAELE